MRLADIYIYDPLANQDYLSPDKLGNNLTVLFLFILTISIILKREPPSILDSSLHSTPEVLVFQDTGQVDFQGQVSGGIICDARATLTAIPVRR